MKESEILDDQVSDEKKEENPPTVAHAENKEELHLPDIENRGPSNLNAVFENPLAGIPREQLFKDVQEFCHKFDLMADLETFQKGALISQNPESASTLPELSEVEKEALIREHTHKWSQPWQLYFLASELLLHISIQLSLMSLVMCSLAAAVQGMDETANNGAQAFYLPVRPIILESIWMRMMS